MTKKSKPLIQTFTRYVLIFAITNTYCIAQKIENTSLTKSPAMDSVKKFKINELVAECKKQKTDWLKFLDEETVFAGIYLLNAGQKDDQPTHEFDEVYYVLKGKSDFQAGSTKMTAYPGKLIYVKAGVGHHFTNIEKDLELLVLFSKAKTGPNKVEGEEFVLSQLEKVGKHNENSWNPFVKRATMSFGLYQLPKVLGGDSTLVHQWDEINVVTKSSAKFSIDGQDMDITLGDIIYVQKGHGHYFHELKSDFDVLILFERKSVENK